MNKYNIIWQKILEEVSKCYNKETFKETFGNMKKIYKYENEIIFLLTENEFIKNKIYKIYLNKINEISKFFFPKENLNFKFILKEQEEQEKENKTNLNINIYGNLKKNYQFENFVLGKNNKFAFEMAKKISENKKTKENPLYIFGNVGLGKTHLLHSIGNNFIKNNKNKKVLYVKADTFVEDFTNQLKKEKMEDFNFKYRNIDLLLLDDIQIMAEAKRTQMEFFKLFDHLYLKNKQIVIASDKSASDLEDIMSRLKSRFEAGLIVDIKKPDFKHRLNILKKKIEDFGFKKIPIKKEIIDFIAYSFVNNIREMEGALLRLLNYVKTYENEVNLLIAQEILQPLLKNKNYDISKNELENERRIKNIKTIISNFYNVEDKEILGKKKHKKYTIPRHIIMYFSKELYKIPYSEIGRFFKKNHSSISKAFKKIENKIKNNIEFRKVINFIKKKIELQNNS